MKTNEMIAGLRNCVTTQFAGCKECPAYCRSASCLNRLHTAAADTLEAQQKRIEELEAERRWIPVTERLPDEDVRVIVRIDRTVWNTAFELDADRRHNGEWVRWGRAVTNWMPMPAKEG